MKKVSYISLIALTILVSISCGRKTIETTPERKDITETIFASGVLEPDNKYNLTAQTEGYILELKFDDGDTVKTGQVLAIIENKTSDISASGAEILTGLAAMNASAEGPSLKQAQLNLQFLKEKYEQDSVQYSRYQKLFQSNSVSKLELENANIAYQNSKTNYLNATQNYRFMKQQTEQQLVAQKTQKDVNGVMKENNEIKAVVGGKIYKRLKQVGDYVRRGEVIAVIGSADNIFSKLSIDETNISKIKVGQKVIIQLNTVKEKNYNAVITEIYPSFDEFSQSFYCKAVFTDKLDFNISGTQLQANIIVSTKTKVLVIPRNYLGYGNKVTVKGKGDVQVETGVVSNDLVEITKGLEDGVTISTTNIK